MGLAGFYERALDQLPGYIGGMGYYPLGLPVLREVIAADYVRRGLPTSPEQIIVTAGALSGVASIARSILGPGARVLAESPSYPNSVSSLRQHGAHETPCHAPLVKGQEMGWFEHGSTIIFFAPSGFTLCEGLVPGSRLRMGQALMRVPSWPRHSLTA